MRSQFSLECCQGGLRGWLKAIAKRWRGLDTGSPHPEPRVNIDLAERILSALHGTTASAWSDAVYALTATPDAEATGLG